jgi:hypothetical protein
MEITRPSLDTTFGAPAWIERRRDEFNRTSTGIRVVGALGWGVMALSLLLRAA